MLSNRKQCRICIHNNFRILIHPISYKPRFVYRNDESQFKDRTPTFNSSIDLCCTRYSATSAFAVDDPFKNKVDIDTDVDNKNTCDESGEGFNQALCVVTDNLETETFTMQGEKNKISIDAEGENHNDCDEKGDGDNETECIITSNRGIGGN